MDTVHFLIYLGPFGLSYNRLSRMRVAYGGLTVLLAFMIIIVVYNIM